MHNVSKNVPVLLNGTVYTQIHINTHLDTFTQMMPGHTEFVAAYVFECFHTYVCQQIAGGVEQFAS